MLPRSLFLFIAASCWLRINAVPVQLQDDYQNLQDDGEDLLDYAFMDNDGAESSGVFEGIDESTDKTSILETIKDTMETMDKLGAFKDKHNINVNANAPKHRKKSKKSKSTSHKRTRSKPDENEGMRRSTQDQATIPVVSRARNARERNIAGAISPNHCSEARRSILNNYSQTINLNSSYLGIDEDFTIKSQAKMKKTHTVFTEDYITLCWIETTTIKEDNSIKPPKRLILREFTISFENAAAIPEEYLSCPEVAGDITSDVPAAVCHTALGESIIEDTQNSRIVNLSRNFREDNIDIHVNKVIKCAMGSVITKDLYRWLNPSESSRQRVEIKVSPETHPTKAFCHKYQKELKPHTAASSNESAECSDEGEQEEVNENNDNLNEVVTQCSGDSCSDAESLTSTIKPLNASVTLIPSIVKEQPYTEKSSDAVIQPSPISGTKVHLGTKKPSYDLKPGGTVSYPSILPPIIDYAQVKRPLYISKPGGILSPVADISENDDHPQKEKPLYNWEPGSTLLPPTVISTTKKPTSLGKPENLVKPSTVGSGEDDQVLTKKPLHSLTPGVVLSHPSDYSASDIDNVTTNDTSESGSLSSDETRDASATRKPKFLSELEQEQELPSPHQPMKVPCVGPNCPEKIPGGLPISDLTLGEGKPQNITETSDEESCEGSDCEDIESINDVETGDIAVILNEKKNITTSSVELLEKEKKELYIPKPFICPVSDQQICDHLEQVSKLQAAEKSSEEEEEGNVENVANDIKKLKESSESLSIEEKGVELGNFVPFSTEIPLIKSSPSHIVSTITSSQLSSLENALPSIHGLKPQSTHGTASPESESLFSSGTVSAEMKTILSSEEDTSGSSPVIKPPDILINQTQQISDLSDSDEWLESSQEREKKYGLNGTKLKEFCDESGNCHESNASYTSRISPSSPLLPTVQTDGQLTALLKFNQSESSPGRSSLENDEEDESCDCDEESEEVKECDPESGTCEPQTIHPSEDKIVIPVKSDEKGPTSPIFIDHDQEKGIGTEPGQIVLKNHKLSLKIHVTLEHIDENEDNSRLAQVEKDVLLNELPEQHGNHSLYWHIQALNKSANDVEALRDLFNCTILEKLTEEAIINQLNMTQSGDTTSGSNDDTIKKRYRRSIGNITVTQDNKNDNESLISSSLLRDFILPHIREDIKTGLSDMLDHILAALNISKSNASEKTNNTLSSPAKSEDDITDGPQSTPIPNRNKRSLKGYSDGSDVEELSRWSHERFTPSNDGSQLRSFTELKILKNFMDAK